MKQSSDTRWRYIFQAKYITRIYRSQSRSSSQTDSEVCFVVSASWIDAICDMMTSCHGNTFADVTNNQTQRIQLIFYSFHYNGIMYVIEKEYKQVRKIIYIYIYVYIYLFIYLQPYKSIISLLSLMWSHSLRSSIYLLSPSKLAFHYSPA